MPISGNRPRLTFPAKSEELEAMYNLKVATLEKAYEGKRTVVDFLERKRVDTLEEWEDAIKTSDNEHHLLVSRGGRLGIRAFVYASLDGDIADIKDLYMAPGENGALQQTMTRAARSAVETSMGREGDIYVAVPDALTRTIDLYMAEGFKKRGMIIPPDLSPINEVELFRPGTGRPVPSRS